MELVPLPDKNHRPKMHEHWGSVIYKRVSFAYQASGVESAESARILGAVTVWYDDTVTKCGREQSLATALKWVLEDLTLCMTEIGRSPHAMTPQKVSALDLILVEPEIKAAIRRVGALGDLESLSPFLEWGPLK